MVLNKIADLWEIPLRQMKAVKIDKKDDGAATNSPEPLLYLP